MQHIDTEIPVISKELYLFLNEFFSQTERPSKEASEKELWFREGQLDLARVLSFAHERQNEEIQTKPEPLPKQPASKQGKALTLQSDFEEVHLGLLPVE